MKKWITTLFILLCPAAALADGWVYIGERDVKAPMKFSSDTGNVIRDAPNPKGKEIGRLHAGKTAEIVEVQMSYGHAWGKVK